MLFHTPLFILGFLPICLTGFFLVGRFGGHWALGWIVLASLFFYGWWSVASLPLLIGSVLANYAIACRLQHGNQRRVWLTAGIGLNLLLLGWFKYADFLLHIARPEATSIGITLPLAISFFTFQQIMFLVETGRPAGPGQPLPRLLPYSAFVTFFPHLIAGPIVRPVEILPQLEAGSFHRPQRVNLVDGTTIFLLGLAKKLVLADLFGYFADVGFNATSHGIALSFFEAWFAVLSYALQIYFDFSGYCDMATGLARMLNVRFPLNFDSPYQSSDIATFWRRWHITLGTFLRDYVYIPLGGSRASEIRRIANLMVTMLLAGLWHGAGWTFVLWGGLHGSFLIVHTLWRRFRRPMPAILGQILTLFAVVVAWVPFRAASLADTMSMMHGLIGINGIVLPRMIVSAIPPLAAIAQPVAVMPSLGDAHTLSFPELCACLLIGWFIVLVLPNVQRMTVEARPWALTASFALTVQALFFAPHVAPFLYFQF